MSRFTGVLDGKTTAAVAIGVLGICVALLLQRFLDHRSLSQFPLNSSQYGSYPKRLMAYVYHAESLYRQGYNEFKNAAYRMTTVDGA